MSAALTITVYRDVENLEPLTREDILDFYRTYIHPSSPRRAKAAVHLVAQASTADLAAKLSSAEQSQKLVTTLTDTLTQMGIPVDGAVLEERFSKLNIADGDVDAMVKTLTGYISEVAQVAEEQLAQLGEQGRLLLGQILPSLGIEVPKADAAVSSAPAKIETKEAVRIEDVKAWKTRMPVSAGATPVKPLKDFEELEPKL